MTDSYKQCIDEVDQFIFNHTLTGTVTNHTWLIKLTLHNDYQSNPASHRF